MALVVIVSLAACQRRRRSPVATGELTFEVVDKATGARIPARLTLTATNGRRLQLTRDALGEDDAGSVVVQNRILTRVGHGAIDVPSGTYDVQVSRGIEWTLANERITIDEGEQAQVRAVLEHVVSLPGWISADFHVHAERSWDSLVPMGSRIHEFLAEGIDVIASTDHNVVADYGPQIIDLNATAELATIVGDEVTTEASGHFGVFPLPPSWNGRTFGAAWRRGHHAAQIFPRIRAEAPEALIQINHPRSGGAMGYFYDEELDPATDTALSTGYSSDYDVIELLNGYKDASRKQFDLLLGDWFHLLDHGHVVTATGNSDTHDLTPRAGYPRNYVQTARDGRRERSPEAIAAALRRHRAFFTTGPLVAMTIGGAGIGDVVTAHGETAIDVLVMAAPWISTARARLYVGGKIVETIELDPEATSAVRLRRAVTVDVRRDTYVVLRVDGDVPLPIIKSERLLPHALSNPIFLDGDGDGMYLHAARW